MQKIFEKLIEKAKKRIPPFTLISLPTVLRNRISPPVHCVDDLNFYTNPQDTQPDGVSDLLQKKHTWAVGETTLFKKIINPGDTIVDIGANLGYFTVLASKLTGNTGKVFAFEPDKTNFKFLQENVKLNFPKASNIKLVNAAVGNKEKKELLYHSPHNKGDHRLVPIEEGFTDTQEVKEVLLDRYLRNTKIDLIKSDTQGYEGKVLKGMRALLKYNKNIQLILEFWPYGLSRSGDTPLVVLNTLHSLGFNLFTLEDARFSLTKLPKKDFSTFLKKITPNQGFVTLFCTRNHSKLL